jgi:hypothetical protein
MTNAHSTVRRLLQTTPPRLPLRGYAAAAHNGTSAGGLAAVAEGYFGFRDSMLDLNSGGRSARKWPNRTSISATICNHITGAATPPHICNRIGLAVAAYVSLGSPLPHLHQDWAHSCHICTRTSSPLPKRRPDKAYRHTSWRATPRAQPAPAPLRRRRRKQHCDGA